ncbi:MAG: hypothetical protein HC869_19875 [Rhodospirillales bacterium]|nr:hypothetical protein [Rhodospirillales bacterium]
MAGSTTSVKPSRPTTRWAFRATLDRIVGLVANRLDMEVCSIYRFAPDRTGCSWCATHGLDPSSVGTVSMRVDEGLTGFVIEKALAIDNIFVFALVFSTFAIPRSTSTGCFLRDHSGRWSFARSSSQWGRR